MASDSSYKNSLMNPHDCSVSGELPVILSPTRGVAGQHVYIDLRMLPELYLSRQLTCKLSFGTLAVDSWFTRISNILPNGQMEEYDVCAADVPPFRETNWFDSHVPVQALVLDGPYQIISMLHVGMFEYLDVECPNNPMVHESLQCHKQSYHQPAASPAADTPPPPKVTMPQNENVAPVGFIKAPPSKTSSSNNLLFVDEDFEQVLVTPWTENEITQGRRIVQLFITAAEDQSTFYCRCRPVVDPGKEGVARQLGDVLVSCIYWPSENQFIVTGVDIIYSVEHILGIEYNTEKKNRIRRNLEKYNPRTISKTSHENCEFFWKIMQYDDPKPRNIESNVKVYPWALFADSLRRIIDKFGPSGSFKGRIIPNCRVTDPVVVDKLDNSSTVEVNNK